MIARRLPLADILGIGAVEIEKVFCCVGYTKEKAKCTNFISKDKRIRVYQIERILETLDPDSEQFETLLEELLALLLCTKNKHREQQFDNKLEDWWAAIEEYGAAELARRGGDTVMGEASDTKESLLDDIDDLTVRIRHVTASDEPHGSSATRRESAIIEVSRSGREPLKRR